MLTPCLFCILWRQWGQITLDTAHYISNVFSVMAFECWLDVLPSGAFIGPWG